MIIRVLQQNNSAHHRPSLFTSIPEFMQRGWMGFERMCVWVNGWGVGHNVPSATYLCTTLRIHVPVRWKKWKRAKKVLHRSRNFVRGGPLRTGSTNASPSKNFGMPEHFPLPPPSVPLFVRGVTSQIFLIIWWFRPQTSQELRMLSRSLSVY